MTTSLPIGKSACRRPLRRSEFGLPASIAQLTTLPSLRDVDVQPSMRIDPVHLRQLAFQRNRLGRVEFRRKRMMRDHWRSTEERDAATTKAESLFIYHLQEFA